MSVTFIQSGRFSAPFDPNSVAGRKFDFDASNSGSLTLSGSEVTNWTNLGSHASSFQRVTTGPQSGVDTKNGLNVLTFNGSTARLGFPAPGGTVFVAQPDTVIMVAKIDAAVADEHLCDSPLTRQLVTGDGATWRMFAGTTVLTGGTADLNWHVFTAKFNGASSVLRVDGVQVISGNPGTDALVDRWAIAWGGSSANLTACKFAQVLVYDTALGTTDTAYLESGLKTKWGTP